MHTQFELNANSMRTERGSMRTQHTTYAPLTLRVLTTYSPRTCKAYRRRDHRYLHDDADGRRVEDQLLLGSDKKVRA